MSATTSLSPPSPSSLPYSPTPMPRTPRRSAASHPSPNSSVPSLTDSDFQTPVAAKHDSNDKMRRTSKVSTSSVSSADIDKEEESEVSVWFSKKRRNEMEMDMDDAWMMRRVGGEFGKAGKKGKGKVVSMGGKNKLPRPKAFIVMKEEGETCRKLGPRRSMWGNAVKYSKEEVRTGRVEFVVEDEKTEMLRKCMSADVVGRVETKQREKETARKGLELVPLITHIQSPREVANGKRSAAAVLRSDDFVEFMRVAAEKRSKKHRKKRPVPTIIFTKAHKLWRKVRASRSR